ncbi:MAG: hypothetical protein IH950_07940 [Bacteroidetes bacterium]|nr:hypothetical protein [Bacteroidota bacterium]MCH8033671.1 hypothetical protein [Bacteroidota bacterium]
MTRKFLITFVCLFAVGISLAQKDLSYLDNDKGTSMEPILAAARPLVEEIEDGDFEIVRMEYDLVFSEKSTYRTLFDGWTYGIAAFGDYRIKDIDLSVYKKSNGRWKLVEEDAENDDVATVTIKPRTKEEYKIVVSVYRFNKGYNVGHYGLMIFHE